jgi:hypothetical protein
LIICPAETMPHGRHPKLILVHASKSRPSGKWTDDDYDVWDWNAKVVGRIFRATAAPPGRSWFWTITVRLPQYPTVRGYTATRDEAMAAFKRAWQGE